MFVVRTMTVRHEREVRIGEGLVGRTWPSRARRDMLFTRQVRLFHGDELVAAATQEWAYLKRTLEPTRAGKAIYDAFTVHEGYPEVALPDETPRPDAAAHHFFDFVTWHGWMDPHGHVNHAAYVDYCDEGVARVLAQAGHDPQQLVPVAEAVHFRAAIGPAQHVTVETKRTGHAGAAGVFAHRIFVDGKVCATATTVRRLAGRDDAGWLPA
jgi:acyl-CoA thioesterase FadM